MFTMRPPPATTIALAAKWQRLAGPRRFVASVRCHSRCHVMKSVSSGAWSPKVPALLTTISTRPNAVVTSRHNRATACASARSAGKSAWPSPGKAASVASAAARLRWKCTATRQPRVASASAMTRPMPREAPVTSALSRVEVVTRASWAKPCRAESQKTFSVSCDQRPQPLAPHRVLHADRTAREFDHGVAVADELQHAGEKAALGGGVDVHDGPVLGAIDLTRLIDRKS